MKPTTLGERILVTLVVVAVLIAAGFAWGYHIAGKEIATVKAQAAADMAKVTADSAQKLAAAERAANVRDQALNAQLAALDQKRIAEGHAYEKTIADLRVRARAGDIRLRASVARDQVCPTVPAANSTVTGGSGTEETADLVPRFTDAILSLAGRVAADVRDYNALLDRYNAVVASCTGGQ